MISLQTIYLREADLDALVFSTVLGFTALIDLQSMSGFTLFMPVPAGSQHEAAPSGVGYQRLFLRRRV